VNAEGHVADTGHAPQWGRLGVHTSFGQGTPTRSRPLQLCG
jgi:hypothetical protein